MIYFWSISFFVPTMARFQLLDAEDYKSYFTGLPEVDGWTGDKAFEWSKNNLPFIDMPPSDHDITATYYFRCKVLREHILPTIYPDAPYTVSECKYLTTESNPTDPSKPVNGTEGCLWGDSYGVINAASGHHISEGRWLRNAKYMDSYLHYFLRGAHYVNGSKAPTYQTRIYTSWQVTAAWRRYLISGDVAFLRSYLGDFVENFKGWIREHRFDRCPSGHCDCAASEEDWTATCSEGTHQCFWIPDGWDAMEGSISGTGCRPSISAAIFGEAISTAFIARAVGDNATTNGTVLAIAKKFEKVSNAIRKMYLEIFWDKSIDFFAVYKLNSSDHHQHWWDDECGALGPEKQHNNCSADLWHCNATVKARELLALGSPYYFNVVPPMVSSKYEVMWKATKDDKTGFASKWGLRTATIDSQGNCPLKQTNYTKMIPCNCYNKTSHGECSWDAPIWPYETSRVLTGLANLLQGPIEKTYTTVQVTGSGMNYSDFHLMLRQYAIMHTRGFVANRTNTTSAYAEQPWIGENLHPDDGYWVARQMMYGYTPGADAKPPTIDRNRDVDYMHSTFIDNVLSGLFGIRGQDDNTLLLNPLTDTLLLPYFAVDNLLYHKHEVAISFDPTGTRYPHRLNGAGCKGLCVWVDGKMIASSPSLKSLNITL